MNEHLRPFIISRIVGDYAQLRSKGLAPAIETYASFWPDDSRQILRPLLLEEYKQSRLQGDTIATEQFLAKHPTVENDTELCLQLLKIELRFSSQDPDIAVLRQRFPQLDEASLKELADQAMFYSVWRRHETTDIPDISPQPNETTDESPSSEFSVSEKHPLSWGKNRAASVNWDEKSIRSSMDRAREHYREALGESPEIIDAGMEMPARESGAEAEKKRRGSLEDGDELTVHDQIAVEEYIGSGAWKDVYKARQQSTLQLVAFKHLREKNDQELSSLVREVRMQAQLTHQNIPPVFSLDVLADGQAVVVEKLVNGSRWSDSMHKRSLNDNLRILLEVAQAIAYAHQRHLLIHRDLKPDNVVVNDAFDEVYVIDWGLAVSIAPTPPEDPSSILHVSEISGIAGTPLYWAPEMARGETGRCSAASDVFLLGAILYEILTRHAPYALFTPTDASENAPAEVGPMLRAVRGSVFPPKIRAPNRFIPDELAAISMKAMSPEPEDRYSDGAAFVEAVKHYQHHAEATLRCDATWKQLNGTIDEIALVRSQTANLHPLTLRLVELSNTFRQIVLELTDEPTDSGIHLPGTGDPVLPTVRSALDGEVAARRQLFDLTLRTGDLTLATAQADLLEKIPSFPPDEINVRRRQVERLLAVRRRARTMKWVALSLLFAFLGSTMLYGYLINRQFRKTEEERQRAEANFQKTREAVKRFYTTVAKDRTLRNEGLIPLRHELLDAAKDYYEEFVAQKSDDPDVIVDQMNSLFDMGYAEAIIGDLHQAIDYYKRAAALGEKLPAIAPDHLEGLDSIAKINKDLGVAYKGINEKPEKILPRYLEALRINRLLIGRKPDDLIYRRNLARILHNLGDYSAELKKVDDARRYYKESLATRQEMLRLVKPPAVFPPEYTAGSTKTWLAMAMMEAAEGNLETAEQEFTEALKWMKSIEDKDGGVFGIDEKFLYGIIFLENGKLEQRLGQHDDAVTSLREARKRLQSVAATAPENMLFQIRHDEAAGGLFELLSTTDRKDEALALGQERLNEFWDVLKRFPDIINYRLIWGQWARREAGILFELDRGSEATVHLNEAIAILEAIPEDKRNDTTSDLLHDLEQLSNP